MSFLELIKKNENLRKIFGIRELKIIEKQLLGIKLKASEKTRLSRDIRKKLETVKILAPYIDEFNLKHGAEIKKIIKEAKEAILETEYYSKIKKIILFGSAVENTLTFRSDIDIAVEFDKISKEEAFKFRVKISSRLPNKVDIQVYNVLPDKIKKAILNNHRILYEHGKK